MTTKSLVYPIPSAPSTLPSDSSSQTQFLSISLPFSLRSLVPTAVLLSLFQPSEMPPQPPFTLSPSAVLPSVFLNMVVSPLVHHAPLSRVALYSLSSSLPPHSSIPATPKACLFRSPPHRLLLSVVLLTASLFAVFLPLNFPVLGLPSCLPHSHSLPPSAVKSSLRLPLVNSAPISPPLVQVFLPQPFLLPTLPPSFLSPPKSSPSKLFLPSSFTSSALVPQCKG